MAKAVRELITIACKECKNRNYHSTRNKKKHSEKLEIKKFCRSCRKHTLHRETK